MHAVFIRAPWVAEHGDDVEVLGRVDEHPVAVRQGNMLAVAFHPELAGETRLHELLLALNGGARDRLTADAGRLAAALGVGAESRSNARPVELRQAVGLGRGLLVDRLLASVGRVLGVACRATARRRARRRRSRRRRRAAARTGWCVSEASPPTAYRPSAESTSRRSSAPGTARAGRARARAHEDRGAQARSPTPASTQLRAAPPCPTTR